MHRFFIQTEQQRHLPADVAQLAVFSYRDALPQDGIQVSLEPPGAFWPTIRVPGLSWLEARAFWRAFVTRTVITDFTHGRLPFLVDLLAGKVRVHFGLALGEGLA